jgi:hypothetical protein
MRQLRCTWRALDDLGLDPALARSPAIDLGDEHEVIRAFVAQRSQAPDGQEVTYLPATRVPVHNLHHGRWRALTWHEKEDDLDVVWLLGVGWHEAGSRDDAYAALKRRDQHGLLFPDETDYTNLEPDARTTQDFLNALAEISPKLVAQAREEPGMPVHGTLADILDVSVVVEQMGEGDEALEDLYVAFYLPPKSQGVLPEEWQAVALGAFFPEADLASLTYGPPFPSALQEHEGWIVVIRWEH